MNMKRRSIRLATALLATLALGVSTAWAGGHHPSRGHYPGHYPGHHSHSSFNWGIGIGYPYFGYAPNYRYWPGYGPAYYPGYGSVTLGYGSWGHGGNYGLSFSLPLYFGPRYATPLPATAVVPATRIVQTVRQEAPADCLQVREYQTQIEIGGKPAPAYGQACLQADGNWRIISGPIAE
ncbi:MAG: hypothetical protein PVJ33_14870 [Lysobacterales bacterium]|jgi:hypothetical protein